MTVFQKVEHRSRMFPFITKQWNPVVGCDHNCTYCWANKLVRNRLSKMQSIYPKDFKPTLIPDRLTSHPHFGKDDFIFVCSLSDLFCDGVPTEWINLVLRVIRKHPDTKFLLLTKNPKRLGNFIIPENCTIGATIETNQNILVSYGSNPVSLAPLPSKRWKAMDHLADIGYANLLISIEPIMDFDVEDVASRIYNISIAKYLESLTVAIGYDNYNNGLIEPSLEKTQQLIDRISKFDKVHVVLKTLREAIPHKEVQAG